MNQVLPLETISDEARIQAFIDAAWPRDPLAEPRVRYWGVAKRTTLFVLLAVFALQYYFFDVYLTIIALPRLGMAALP